MLNIKFKKLVIFASVLFLQPMVSPGSLAFAKRRSSPRAFSFFVEAGKASQEECDGERKVPRKLKHLKEYAKAGSYMGSEVQTFEIKGKDNAEMWKHFFSSKSSCNTVLAKTPSSVNSAVKDAKQELPPDDSADSDDDDQTDDPQEGPEASAK
jgi:hypothetical protein